MKNSNFKKTSNFTKYLAIGLVGVFILSVYLAYQVLWRYTIEDKKHEIHKMVLMEHSIRHYVDGELKPLFYDLKATGELEKAFYSPKGFSATYVISHIFDHYKQLLELNDNALLPQGEGVQFRIASDNPLNLKNQATPEEIRKLTFFRNHSDVAQKWEITQDETPVLKLYKPSQPNTAQCLICHGNPEQAPPGMVEIYGNTHGFFEPVGLIRAISVYQVDLGAAYHRLYQLLAMISIALFVILATIFGVVLWVHRKLEKDQEVILAQKQALYQLANEDALTGLFNRHKLQEDLPRLLDQLKAKQLKSLVAILLDIDHFKNFNDQYGHDVGDIVLQTLAQGIRSVCPEGAPYIYRLGGEEFLILLPNAEVTTLVERVKACQQQLPNKIEGVAQNITYSIGVAIAEAGDTPKTLLKKADLALYEVKNTGRNDVKLYSGI